MPQMEITDKEKVVIDTIRSLDEKERHIVLITLRGREPFKVKKILDEIDVGFVLKQAQASI